MKFLLAHGEKVFLAVVVAISGWSLVGSMDSYRRKTVVPEETRNQVKEIEKAVRDAEVPDLQNLTYADHLAAVFKGGAPGRGRRFRPWTAYEPPRPDAEILFRRGELGVPSGVKADAGRMRITVSWSPLHKRYVKVLGCRVFKWKPGGEPPEEPTFTPTGTSVVDDDVEAEQTYLYKVGAVGVAAPENENEVVDQPEGTRKVVVEGLVQWWTDLSGEVTATVFSNVEFVYLGYREEWDVRYARIKIKVWNTDKGDWDVYRTDPGIKQGERIKGYRADGLIRREFDSGYIFEKVGTETVKIPRKRRILDPKTGKSKIVIEWVDAKVEFMIARQDGTDRVRKVYKEADKATIRKAKQGPGAGRTPSTPKKVAPARPKVSPKKEEAAGADPFAKERAGVVPAGQPRAGRPGGVAPAAPPVASDGMVEYQKGDRTINFRFPVGWTEVPGDFHYGDEADRMLMEGFVVAYSGTVDDMIMVIQQPFDEDGPLGDGTEEIVKKYAEACKKRTLSAFPGADLFQDVKVMIGREERFFGYFIATATVPTLVGQERGKKDLTVARYCGYTSRTKHMVTFICRTGDYEGLRQTFAKVLATLWW